jgi:HEAT repeat protein
LTAKKERDEGRGGRGSGDDLRLTLGSGRQRASSEKGEAAASKIEGLIDLIGNEQFSIRTAAVKKLSEQGERAVPALLEALRDGLWYTRECAAQALGDIGSAGAIEPLIESLKDSNIGVRWAAARALCQLIEKERLVDVAEAITHVDGDTQRYVLQVLRKASPLAGRELESVLGKDLKPSKKEQEKELIEQTPSVEPSLASALRESARSLWERLRRFLEAWS